ncbi:hypothetical protein [Cereibacter sphaeroides]|jgi:hypothetical protein|uniref:hypothetical protein n=1 Tax=Cereibacter sphaeroides TaxID=1063 RepID=UPI0002F85FED
MGLSIRMALYFVFSFLAGQGLVVFDAPSGRVTFDLESVAVLLTGLAGFAVTFVASRVAKARGGKT